MKLNLSFDIAVLVSLISIFFYTCGQSYLAAYLGVFYIDPVTLNFSTLEKINWGFLHLANNLTFIFLFTAFISLTIIVLCFFKLKFNINIKNFTKNKPNYSSIIFNNNSYKSFQYKNIRLFVLSLSISLIFLILFSSFAIIDIKTTKKAKSILENPQSLLLINSKQHPNTSLYLVKCGLSLCAAIDNNKNTYFLEPKDLVIIRSKRN